MSKKSKKNEGSLPTIGPKPERKPSRSLNTSDAKLSAVIGASNLIRWTQIRIACNYHDNEEFVKVLLDLAAAHLLKNNTTCEPKQNNHDNNKDGDNETKQRLQMPTNDKDKNENNNKKKEKEHKHKKRKVPEEQEKKMTKPKLIQSVNNIIKDKKSDKKNENKVDTNVKLKPSIMVNISNDLLTPLQVSQPKVSLNISEVSKVLLIENIVKSDIKESNNLISIKGDIDKSDKSKKLKTENDIVVKTQDLQLEQISIAPQQPQQILPLSTLQSLPQLTNKLPDKQTLDSQNLCGICDNEHLPSEQCILSNPQVCISDSIALEIWKSTQNDVETEDDMKPYAICSLPFGLKLDDVNQPGWENQPGVFSTQLFGAFTQFGPLVAPIIKEVDVAEDCTMRYMFEIIKGETERVFFNAENEEESNWIRYLRPAPSRELRNILVVNRDDCLFFVTSRSITKGEELVYWQDDISGNKKKMEKTNCGGCNMTFQHPLYYRIHCSVFHDVRYSLTIRKYHCKVCGAAVLGKENIMKHASELHNGQGAYQCQFCKKFFLRLNYLEMHRTYGCSANPHRSRPLCDFCGRKFCQPQKLKVHIKRMHSDMSEVLKEFQCKNCMKLLGSRAALQRHFKEVHQKQMDGACACNKCGKTFQNRSNLKIHMLTHSGIKPFRCNQISCAAAFTTKQCLQFHYKKVHGYTEDMMPKIERSVDYTFEAYSGNGDDDLPTDAILSATEPKTEDNNHAITANSEALLRSSINNTASNSQDRLISNSLDATSVEQGEVSEKLEIVQSDQSTNCHSPGTPPTNIDVYTPNMKILTKGSKKWIGEQDIYVDQRKADFTPQNIGLNGMQHIPQEQQAEAQEHQAVSSYDKPYEANAGKILGYNRHESNASLLVEAALDSVCSEPNIDIDVANTPCTESLVNNLYTLSNVHVHDNDSLADVTYPQSVDATDSRDINLISPSVNEQISVTDDIDEIRHSQPIGIDYSSFHQEDFSPPNSPRNFRDYMQSPQGTQMQAGNHTQHHQHNHSLHNQHPQHTYEKQTSPGGVASPPRYDFGAAVVNPESDDSNNGIGVQNLSLHAEKFPDVPSSRDGIQLDLSIYKSHYSFDSSFLRKDTKRFEIIDVTEHTEHEHDNEHTNHNHKNYLIDNEDTNKFSLNGNVDNDNLDSELKDFEGMEDADVDGDVDGKSDKDLDLSVRSAVPDLRSKFDLDLDLRKSYEMDGELRRTYDTLDDFRMKNYDLDNLDALRSNLERKNYESLIDDFRTDRNFEPIVLNTSELQGLDMSARGYHNYPNLNRYHPLYAEVDRSTVDLRLNYSPPPPPPAYTHPDILRVSLDLAQPTRHSVDLSLRSQIANSRLLTEHSLQTSRLGLDQSRLLPGDLTVAAPRHIPPDRLISDMSNRILSDHTTNRLLGNDQLGAQRLMGNEQRMLQDDRLIEQPRLLEQNRLLGNGSLSPVSYSGYSLSPSPYHPTALPPRPHVTSPNPTPYHHYSAYY